MSDRFVLIGQTAVPCEDLFEWARWFETADRRVAVWEFGPILVSTVFLGLDHSFARYLNPEAPPILFETMLFVCGDGVHQTRCSTWSEAEDMHRAAIAYLCSMWRRPIELASWIHDGLKHWMWAWDRRFQLRYGKDILLLGMQGVGDEA